MDLINSFTSNVVHKALDGHAARQKALSSNQANVETPGYRRKDALFEDALSNAVAKRQSLGQANTQQASNSVPLAMKATQQGHFALNSTSANVQGIQPQMVESEDLQFRNDGNSVDLESEMAQMAKNTQRYVPQSNIQSRSQRSLRNVIQNGG